MIRKGQIPANGTTPFQTFAELADSRAALQARERHLNAEHSRLNASLAPLKRERERLEAALNSYSRYGEGARNALRLDHPGIVRIFDAGEGGIARIARDHLAAGAPTA